ncbi:hypothetical protein [Phaeovulum sp.]|uniref:hypothetical protein n=1 Tax=Phaeovulum sp. TaxID=2934796 RepID=UPI0039E21B53
MFRFAAIPGGWPYDAGPDADGMHSHMQFRLWGRDEKGIKKPLGPTYLAPADLCDFHEDEKIPEVRITKGAAVEDGSDFLGRRYLIHFDDIAWIEITTKAVRLFKKFT